MHQLTAGDLRALAEGAGLGDAGIHAVGLDGQGEARADDGRWRYPASLIKLPIAVAAAVAVESRRARWDEPLHVAAGNMTVNDAASPLVPGYVTDLRTAVTLMLQRSDNVATNILIERLDRRRITADVHALGFSATAVRRKLSGSLPLIEDPVADGRNTFAARDCAALLAALAARRLPGSAQLLESLAVSYWDVKLSRGLTAEDRFAHKTGDTDAVSHDAGILTLADGSRWVLVVQTDLPSSDEHDARFGAFMRALRPRLLR